MNYMQKIATAAVSGAVASSAAMALNRHVVEPFRERLHRREQLAELKDWYEEELSCAYDFAARFTDHFFETRQREAQAGHDVSGASTSQAELSEFKINWYVWKYKELAVVKERSARLSGISPRRADNERAHAARLRAKLGDEEDTLRRENYPMDAVHGMIATFK